MKCWSLLNWIIALLMLFGFSTDTSGTEKLNRGLIALEREDGSVFLSWRLLDTDPDDIAFRIKRRSSDSSIDASDLTKSWPCMPTNFIDLSASKDSFESLLADAPPCHSPVLPEHSL